LIKWNKNMKCNQSNCDKNATYLFTWPNENQKGICEECSKKLKAIANAMGLYIQLIKIE